MQKKNILNRFKDVLGQYCAINQFVELSKGALSQIMIQKYIQGIVLSNWQHKKKSL